MLLTDLALGDDGSARLADFVLDSGATAHVSNVLLDFVAPRKLESPVTIRTARSGATVTATHCGDIELRVAMTDGSASTIAVRNALYARGLSRRILSIKRATADNPGMRITFANGAAAMHIRVAPTARPSRFGAPDDVAVKLSASGGLDLLRGEITRPGGRTHKAAHLEADGEVGMDSLVSALVADDSACGVAPRAFASIYAGGCQDAQAPLFEKDMAAARSFAGIAARTENFSSATRSWRRDTWPSLPSMRAR